jgi:hypothetical protein
LSPEKAQIEFVCAGAAVGDDWPTGMPVGEPGPLISPAHAGPAPRAAIAIADTAVVMNVFACILGSFLGGFARPQSMRLCALLPIYR